MEIRRPGQLPPTDMAGRGRPAVHAATAWRETTTFAPPPVDAAIDTTPVWKPILSALRLLSSGGRLVINAIRKENQDRILLADLDYPSQLWLEKEIKSVANVSRSDIEDFLPIAASAGIRPEVQTYALDQANQALMELKTRRIRGAKVLVMR